MSLLLECSVRALLIAAAVFLVLRFLRIANPRARYSAWCAVLAAMLLLPAFCAWGPKAAFHVLPDARQLPAWLAWTAPQPGLSPVPIRTSLRPQSSAIRLAPAASGTRPFDPFSLALGLYWLVTAAFLARLLHAALRVASLRRRATREGDFLSSPDCACPVTVGFWKPDLIFPASWKDWPIAELDAALLHERCHLQARDPLIRWLAALNRSVFWFHPLAWWLERELAALAEQSCDAAVVLAGHAPDAYCEYLIRQARSVKAVGARLAPLGTAMGPSGLELRIRRLLAGPPEPFPARKRMIAAASLTVAAVALFTSLRLDGQGRPSPEEIDAMRRRSAAAQAREQAILDRARSLTPAQAAQLFAALKLHPDDEDDYWVLVRHYEHRVNVQDLDALRLWFIEHRPGLHVANIDPHFDPDGYAKGRQLWLSHLQQPNPSDAIYSGAASFLEGGDKPLAESVLLRAQNAAANKIGWSVALGQHYGRAILGANEPPTEMGVVRIFSAEEANGEYARHARAVLDQSTDTRMLAAAAVELLNTSLPFLPAFVPMMLAQTYVDRAIAIDPGYVGARRLRAGIDETIRRINAGRPASQR